MTQEELLAAGASAGVKAGMNAQERRAARRKAEQQQQQSNAPTSSSCPKVKAEPDASSPDVVNTHPSTGGSVPSTAKERRAAKRAAERAAASTGEKVPLAAGASVKVGMNAKERRAARRKAEQQQQQSNAPISTSCPKVKAEPGTSSPNAGNTNPGTGGSVPSTAKERRAAKRAAERAALTATATPNVAASDMETTLKERQAPNKSPARVAADTSPTDSIGDTEVAAVATGKTTAKERRKLRREEERKKRERETDSGAASAPPAKRIKEDDKLQGGRVNPFIVFVGQLAFSTTAKRVEEHFRKRGSIAGKMKVRLLTRKGTNPPQSRGMAFVEVEDAESAYQCLSLHHSRLDGRLLNIEQTCGGGKEKRGALIQEKRGEQKEYMKSVVQRVLGEFIDAGRLGKTELDEAAQRVLEKMEAKVVERAVKDYCDKPDRLELHNPSAWFTHHAHELCFRSDPEDLEAGARDWLNDEKIKANGRSRDKERATKKARGERVNGDGVGGGSGRAGGRGGEWSSRGGGSRVMGRGRGGGGGGGRGRGEGGGDVRSRGSMGNEARVPADTGRVVGDGAGDDAGGLREKEGIHLPGSPAAGPQDEVQEERGRGKEGAESGQQYPPPREEQLKRDTSDLMSIFPSLRGRGGGRGGMVGGRGGGGRGFRQGGIRS